MKGGIIFVVGGKLEALVTRGVSVIYGACLNAE